MKGSNDKGCALRRSLFTSAERGLDSLARAEFVKGAGELFGNGLGCAALDNEALHEVHQLAIAKNGDGRRSGRIVFEVGAGALGSLAVLAGENGDLVIGSDGIAQGQAQAWAHTAGSAAANGIDHDHGCAGGGERRVDGFGRTRFLKAGACELLTHGDEHNFWI